MTPGKGEALAEPLVGLIAKAVSILVALFLVLPVLIVFPLSFTPDSLLIFPLRGLSLRWYHDFFTNPAWVSALWNSVLLAVSTTCLTTLLGTLAALGLTRITSRWRGLLTALLLTPMIVPVIIGAVGMFFLFARFGLVGNFPGLLLAHSALALPLVIVAVTATLDGFDRNLNRAAYACGAAPAAVFWHVTRPLILPGILTGAVFAFVTSFDDIVCVIFLGGPEFRTLPRQIWSGVKETVSPTITVAAVLLIMAAMSLALCVELLRRRAQRLRGQSA